MTQKRNKSLIAIILASGCSTRTKTTIPKQYFKIDNESMLEINIKKFINLGSACIYPKVAKQPIKEDYLLGGYLEKTNEGYALAKIASLKLTPFLFE